MGAWALQGGVLNTVYEQPDDLVAGVKWQEEGIIWEHKEDIFLRDNTVAAVS